MPKTSLKQKNRKRVTSLILANNIDNPNNNNLIDIKPSFPPTLTIDELIKNSNANNKPKLVPNAFIVYRMALMKEYRIKKCKIPPVGKVSKIAKSSWNMEPKNVKDFYESLVKDAKSIYKQNNIQIVLDKHMNDYAENKQKSNYMDFCTEKENKEHVEVQLDSNRMNHPTVGSTDTSLVNSLNFNPSHALNDREYIRMLEQTIDYLLKR
ncbi:unnamed protein product [Rhizophagus irregularis]|uniref:MATA-HMG n=1 Tax=Rhizophagus irregularis TaxID=588596 RepID=A0A1B1EUZ2_9GLOM|nr:MATA-HMG [Rhizophagus irregularis]PKY42819.1 hypothetical protein RhiirA4_507271 [Rhizophagus irregularis]CAB4433171.1 unnamed protein product [Rhizophagus irregularis]